MRTFKYLFHIGFAAGVLLVGLAAAGLYTPSLRQVIRPSNLLVYDGLVLGHVLSLYIIGRRVAAADVPEAANWLYTAGFMHTLLALGLAVINGGYLLVGAEAITNASLGMIVAPMGAAVIPHFVGVWSGMTLESGRMAHADDLSFLQKLASDADIAKLRLQQLYDQREQLIVKEMAGLEQVNRLYGSIHTTLAASAKDVGDAAKSVSTQTVTAAKNVTQASSILIAGFDGITDSLQKTEGVVNRLKTQLAGSTSDAGELAKSFRSATEVVQDIEKLHRSIVELLSNELFRQSV
jgi:hypothetical protein